MIAAWICPRRSPGWWTRPAPRPALTVSWPNWVAGCWPTACRWPAAPLTLAVPHPIIARRTWLWRAETGAVIEALGFTGGPLSQAGRDWLAELGPVQEDTVGPAPNSPVLGWAGTRPFSPAEADRLRQAARFVAAPLAALAARAALTALLEAYLGRRSAARVQAGACAAAPAKPSAPRCSTPICAASPLCPRQRSLRR